MTTRDRPLRCLRCGQQLPATGGSDPLCAACAGQEQAPLHPRWGDAAYWQWLRRRILREKDDHA
jgi:hypothetical protein